MNHKTVLFPGDAQRLLFEASSAGIPEESPPVSVSLSVKRIVMLARLRHFALALYKAPVYLLTSLSSLKK